MRYRNRTLFTLLFAGMLSLTTAQTLAEQDAHHHHGGGAVAKLSLHNGAKWKTDATLRQGMEHIRNLLEPQLTAIHNDKLKPKQYGVLTKKINAELSGIVTGCKLDKEADAMLHLVLADIIEGTDGLGGKNKQLGRHGGTLKIYQALENYNTYFDHPGWRPITHVE